MTTEPAPPARLNWTNTVVIAVTHVAAVAGVVYLFRVHTSWWTVGLALFWFTASCLAISGGYHRLFSHRSYQASRVLRAVYLLFGAAAVQNSALKWSADHRMHHAFTDQPGDPYSISRGFFWAHIGWVLVESPASNMDGVRDLSNDPLVRLQHRFYVPLALLMNVMVPAALGMLWGDPIGAVLVAGMLRLTLQWHVTFSINSFAHVIGSRPYAAGITARDSFLTALISFGEGYHNFHHRFQNDYRNGVRWFHFDPSKWMICSLSWVGIARDLRRVPKQAIRAAREAAREAVAAARKAPSLR